MIIRRCLSVSTLCILAWLSAGCPPPGGGNPPSPPSLIAVVQLGTNPADTTQGGIDLNLADVSRSGFPSGLKIRLIATALDNASGIASLTLDLGPDELAKSKLGWQCAIRRGSEIIGTPEEAPLAFSPPIPDGSGNQPSKRIDSVLDPIAMIADCPMGNGGGPVNIRGHFRVVATNGVGLVTKSKTFIFDYNDIGSH